MTSSDRSFGALDLLFFFPSPFFLSLSARSQPELKWLCRVSFGPLTGWRSERCLSGARPIKWSETAVPWRRSGWEASTPSWRLAQRCVFVCTHAWKMYVWAWLIFSGCCFEVLEALVSVRTQPPKTLICSSNSLNQMISNTIFHAYLL